LAGKSVESGVGSFTALKIQNNRIQTLQSYQEKAQAAYANAGIPSYMMYMPPAQKAAAEIYGGMGSFSSPFVA